MNLDPVRPANAHDLTGHQQHHDLEGHQQREIEGKLRNIRHDRPLCQEVKLRLGFRWFCELDLGDKVRSSDQVMIVTVSPGAKGRRYEREPPRGDFTVRPTIGVDGQG